MAEETKKLWNIEPINEAVIHLNDPEGWWKAIVIWDGSVHLYECISQCTEPGFEKNINTEGNYEYTTIGISELDDFIDRLIAIKKLGYKYFSSEHHRQNYWSDKYIDAEEK